MDGDFFFYKTICYMLTAKCSFCGKFFFSILLLLLLTFFLGNSGLMLFFELLNNEIKNKIESIKRFHKRWPHINSASHHQYWQMDFWSFLSIACPFISCENWKGDFNLLSFTIKCVLLSDSCLFSTRHSKRRWKFHLKRVAMETRCFIANSLIKCWSRCAIHRKLIL